MPLSQNERAIARWLITFVGFKILTYVTISRLAKWSKTL